MDGKLRNLWPTQAGKLRGMFWDKATIRKYNEVSGKWLRQRSDLWWASCGKQEWHGIRPPVSAAVLENLGKKGRRHHSYATPPWPFSYNKNRISQLALKEGEKRSQQPELSVKQGKEKTKISAGTTRNAKTVFWGVILCHYC